MMAVFFAALYVYNLYLLGWLNDGWRFYSNGTGWTAAILKWLGYYPGMTETSTGGIRPLGFLFGGTGAAITTGVLWFIVPTLFMQFMRQGPAGTFMHWLKAPVVVQQYFRQAGNQAVSELCAGAGAGLVVGAFAFGYSSWALAAGLGVFLGSQGSRIVSLLVSSMWSAAYSTVRGPGLSTPSPASGTLGLLGGIAGLIVRQAFPTSLAFFAGLGLLAAALYWGKGGMFNRQSPLITFLMVVVSLAFVPCLLADDGGFVESGKPQTFAGFLDWLRETGQAGNVRDLALLHSLFTALMGGGTGAFLNALAQLPPDIASQFQTPRPPQPPADRGGSRRVSPPPDADKPGDKSGRAPGTQDKGDKPAPDDKSAQSPQDDKPGKDDKSDKPPQDDQSGTKPDDDGKDTGNKPDDDQKPDDKGTGDKPPDNNSTDNKPPPDPQELINRLQTFSNNMLEGVEDPNRRAFWQNFLDRHRGNPEEFRTAINAVRTQMEAAGFNAQADAAFWGGWEDTAADVRDWSMTINRGLARVVPGGGKVVQIQGLVTGAINAYDQGGAGNAAGSTLAQLADTAISNRLGIPTGGIVSTIYNNNGDLSRSASQWSDQYNPASYVNRINQASAQWPDNPLDAVRNVLDTGLDAADARDDVKQVSNRIRGGDSGDGGTKPPASTDAGDDTTTKPPASTDAGDDKTTKPPASTDAGDDTTTKPPASTDAGDDTTTKPPASTDAGDDKTTKPPASTDAGDDTTKPPASTDAGDDTTTKPHASTDAGDDTTTKPPASTDAGDDTTTKPPASTDAGDDTTTKPPASTDAGDDTTTKPPASTDAGDDTTTKPPASTDAGDDTTTKPPASTDAGDDTTTKPPTGGADDDGGTKDRLTWLREQRADLVERLGPDHPNVKALDERIRQASGEKPPTVQVVDPDAAPNLPVWGKDKGPDQGTNMSAEEARRPEFVVRADGTVESGANNPLDRLGRRESIIQVDPITGKRTVIHGPDVPDSQKAGIAARLNRDLDGTINKATDDYHDRQQRIKDQSASLVHDVPDDGSSPPPKPGASEPVKPPPPPSGDEPTPPAKPPASGGGGDDGGDGGDRKPPPPPPKPDDDGGPKDDKPPTSDSQPAAPPKSQVAVAPPVANTDGSTTKSASMTLTGPHDGDQHRDPASQKQMQDRAKEEIRNMFGKEPVPKQTHAAHLGSNQFGGPGGTDNLVIIPSTANVSANSLVEKQIQAHLESGAVVDVKVTATTLPGSQVLAASMDYHGTATYPDGRVVPIRESLTFKPSDYHPDNQHAPAVVDGTPIGISDYSGPKVPLGPSDPGKQPIN
ncbi:MAG: hypothetical protein U1F71_17025 [Verrucomicrobiaceae bacterium]